MEAITMTYQLADQLEGAIVLSIANHSFHDGLQTKVVHINVEDAVQTRNRLAGLIPLHVLEVGKGKLFRFVLPYILLAGGLLRMISNINESLRNFLSLLRR